MSGSSDEVVSRFTLATNQSSQECHGLFAQLRDDVYVDDHPLLPPGTMIDQFTILEKIGSGATSQVYAAYDRQLDRKVAIKTLQPSGRDGPNSVLIARMEREAKALAQLSHPNVVAVHDFGVYKGMTWIAMEFVDGYTLKQWIRDRPRSWPDVLKVLIGTANGVAAAHDAGFVHRDLKPENVMIGTDGRIRVTDFGLVRGQAVDPTDSNSGYENQQTCFDAALPSHLTKTGANPGTPAYMAPEQWRGEGASAFADQFSWSVMAWELLFGERPFPDETKDTLRTAVLSGRRRPSTKPLRAPGWLRQVIDRGLSTDPSRRWPSMNVLVVELSRGQLRARRRAVAIGLFSLMALIAGAWAQQIAAREADLHERRSNCNDEGATIAQDWNNYIRKQVRQSLSASGGPLAGATASKLQARIDSYASSWRMARTVGCLNEVHGRWPADTLDRSRWCLDQGRMGLRALLREISESDTPSVGFMSIEGAANLPLLNPCLNKTYLDQLPVPPIAKRKESRDAHSQLSRSIALESLGKYQESLEAAQASELTARDLKWTPLTSASKLRVGIALNMLGRYKEAEAALMDAYFEARDSGTVDVAAEASIWLVGTVGERLVRPTEGFVWARHAASSIRTLSESAESLTAKYHLNLGNAYLAAAMPGSARNEYDIAINISRSKLGSEHPMLAKAICNAAIAENALGDTQASIASFSLALELQIRILGDGHPLVSQTMHNLANVYKRIGKHKQAAFLYSKAYAVRAVTLGPNHVDVADSLIGLGDAEVVLGRPAVAIRYYEQALAIRRSRLGPNHTPIGHALGQMATAYESMGDDKRALSLSERALSVFERTASNPSDKGIILINLAELHRRNGANVNARRFYERALDTLDVNPRIDDFAVSYSLRGLAALAIVERHFSDAVALAKRALVLQEQVGAPSDVIAETRFILARAIWATGRDRESAIALAEHALSTYRGLGDAAVTEMKDVSRWLSARRRNVRNSTAGHKD